MVEKDITFTATFRARIRLAETEKESLETGEPLESAIGDAITDIDIPENHQCFYVEDSFQVVEN